MIQVSNSYDKWHISREQLHLENHCSERLHCPNRLNTSENNVSLLSKFCLQEQTSHAKIALYPIQVVLTFAHTRKHKPLMLASALWKKKELKCKKRFTLKGKDSQRRNSSFHYSESTHQGHRLAVCLLQQQVPEGPNNPVTPPGAFNDTLRNFRDKSTKTFSNPGTCQEVPQRHHAF